ncbi:hypothetical protein [Natronobacterium gregoryi]|uniref:Uncharacterized protein n=2 Tax=Natronobacterium gregoryi TaxID=44930 RepID=L0AKX1_NATGS|nr:hypothetical protein [Natronobacterium gregoryi]AFZ73685.1 hypothetical protein Natgr_2525 [Natronobacterium gregoryi SP2]ELY67695.1 hypothetical protein C490_10752 [Natronobacterium gregoryi SP2]PLK19554.1 hypothetical protein CYV19_14045 [Natronobacterium gregoryi SP2]SFJ01120.1 hypothetical protein SAMN05443661_11159 [Natronobacterium gregoryi]
METNPSRRRLLQLGGVGATASLAGCSQFDLSDDDDGPDVDGETELEVDREPEIDPEDGITGLVQPGPEEMQDLEAEIMAEIEAGDLEQMEAQDEFERRRTELTVERAVAFESEIEADDELSIEAGMANRGAFLLAGPDERLMDELRDGDVSGLVPGEEYGLMLEQQLQAEAAPTPGQGAEPDPEDED